MVEIPALAQTRVVPLTRIRRERLLPMRGEVVATIGSRVDPLDIIARSKGLGHLRPVPVGRYMNLSETALPKYLLKKPGDEVAARDIIASKPELMGTLQRIYRAPGAGRVAAVQGTWLTVELAEAPVELKALYRGSVINVMPSVGAVVEATGSLVQGVWGSGGEGYGVLKKIVDAPTEVLDADKIDVSARGAVLLAGAGVTEQTLRRSSHERVAGIIVGGLAPNLRAVIAELGLPVLVTEGFGERAMAAPIFDLLAAHQGEETSLNTTTSARGGVRPEIFIPAISMSGAPLDPQSLSPLVAQVGAAVRVLDGIHEGALGKIANVPEFPQPMESGVSAWGADIQLAGGEQVFVPWQNLELIG
ncbi:MAG: hypothetical protein HY782_01230 [Chloroflexi bacterium]|nr:hypothetical protein [Chloroflexota bacterium]